jgi:hypothetical protein
MFATSSESSMVSPTSSHFDDVSTWKRITDNGGKINDNNHEIKIMLTVNDESGQEINYSKFSPTMSPNESSVDDDCFYFGENVGGMETKKFEKNFSDDFDNFKSQCIVQNEEICKKCGHGIVKH